MKKALISLCLGVVFGFMLLPCAVPNSHAKEVNIYGELESYVDAANTNIKSKKITLDQVTAEALAKELSAWTGLDYTLNKVTMGKDAIVVDWSPKSTLIANLDDRKQKEEFFFFDADSMRWFMLESLYHTLSKNFKNIPIYYTMDGGKVLSFEELSLLKSFPKDKPYKGKMFYTTHADENGKYQEK